MAEFAGKRGARKRDTRAESEIGGEFEPDECISLDRWVLCGGRASIFCECTSSIGAVNEIDGRPEKWLSRTRARGRTDRRTPATNTYAESLWRAVELQSHTHASRLALTLTHFGSGSLALSIAALRQNQLLLPSELYTYVRCVLVKLGPHCSKIIFHQYTQ